MTEYKILGFDCEDDGQGNFIGGCTYDAQTKTTRSFTSKYHMRKFLESYDLRGYCLSAHNAEYDIAHIWGLKHLDHFDYYAKSGSNFKLAVLKHGEKKVRTVIFDSWGHFQGPLRELAPLIGMEKGTDPGPERPWKERKEYCALDAAIVGEFMLQLQEAYLSGALGTSLHPSAGGSAIELLQRKYLEISWRALPKSIWGFQVAGSHGGRAEAFFIGKKKGPIYIYDVHSLYPYIASQAKFPSPNHFVFKRNPGPNCLNYEGITRAYVRVKGGIPPLPLKRKKLLFPIGTFCGSWANNHLRYAEETGQVEILKLVSTCVSTESGYYLKKFMEDVYAIRIDPTQSSAVRAAAKWIMNALTGKFKQGDSVEIWDSAQDTFSTIKTLPPSYSVPAWYSIITGGGQAHMHSLFDSKTFYTHTDSIHTTRKYKTSKGLGGLKLESTWPYEHVKGISLLKRGGRGRKAEYVVKGCPQQSMRLDGSIFSPAGEVFDKGVTHWRKPLKMLEARRRHMKENTWVDKPYAPTFDFDKRNVLKDGRTTPLKIQERVL